ncbi:hypothetical protein Heshes_18420 [Alicyclobacillus hesperidum]|uniref:bis(5'-nucleosyl)-tetraphosphatase (symmetrical) n=1 Tax=Alicyclobacillus hesperidum TaxID=89784 RepID=A0A1H2UB30_9BACL|nr:bis(5'-nucleosyl)-tetraphosphatase (symmetrical) YqeK [Alicyclobacillus hesperidum]GLV14158.1 hypothetical protein Heshes_18420 [Alicyclobacillus hesperidum]SDW53402.1 putative HD superfamily hydrolase of NAD metabolism [Alicyclobacillus hesperidum]
MAEIKLDRLLQDLRRQLSDVRFRHVEGVVQTARDLADRFGVCPSKAEVAAWLHDFAREWSKDRLLRYVKEHAISLPDEWLTVPLLLHGPVAAHIGKQTYQIEDEEILDAVRYHTTGRPNMTDLDLVLFVADAIEPNRSYPGVEAVRAALTDGLANAARASLDNTITYLIATGRPLGLLAVAARNSLLERGV